MDENREALLDAVEWAVIMLNRREQRRLIARLVSRLPAEARAELERTILDWCLDRMDGGELLDLQRELDSLLYQGGQLGGRAIGGLDVTRAPVVWAAGGPL